MRQVSDGGKLLNPPALFFPTPSAFLDEVLCACAIRSPKVKAMRIIRQARLINHA